MSRSWNLTQSALAPQLGLPAAWLGQHCLVVVTNFSNYKGGLVFTNAVATNGEGVVGGGGDGHHAPAGI